MLGILNNKHRQTRRSVIASKGTTELQALHRAIRSAEFDINDCTIDVSLVVLEDIPFLLIMCVNTYADSASTDHWWGSLLLLVGNFIISLVTVSLRLRTLSRYVLYLCKSSVPLFDCSQWFSAYLYINAGIQQWLLVLRT